MGVIPCPVSSHVSIVDVVFIIHVSDWCVMEKYITVSMIT